MEEGITMEIVQELREKFLSTCPQFECEEQYVYRSPTEFNTKAYTFYVWCDERPFGYRFGYYEYNENRTEPPALLENLSKQYLENPDNQRFGICYLVNATGQAFILSVVFYRRHKWSEKELFDKINTNDLQTLLALEKLFLRQTNEEISSKSTIEKNGKGLNAYDAQFLTQWWLDGTTKIGIRTYLKQIRIAREKLKAGERGVNFPENPMTPKQMAHIRKVLHKYRKQLLDIVNG